MKEGELKGETIKRKGLEIVEELRVTHIMQGSWEDVNDEDAKVRNLPSEYIKEEKEHNVNGSTVIHNTEKDGLNTRETNTELKISPSQENGVTTDSSDQMSHSQEDRKNLPGDTVQQPQDAKPGSAAPAPTASTREDVNDEDAKVWNLPCESIKEEKEHNVNESIVIHNTEKDEVNTRETNTELKISPSQENGGTTDSSGQMSHSQEDRKNLPGDTVQQPQEAKPGSAGPAPTAGTRQKKTAVILDPTVRFEKDVSQALAVDQEKQVIYRPCVPHLSERYNAIDYTWEGLGRRRTKKEEKGKKNEYEGKEKQQEFDWKEKNNKVERNKEKSDQVKGEEVTSSTSCDLSFWRLVSPFELCGYKGKNCDGVVQACTRFALSEPGHSSRAEADISCALHEG
ncbi:hypothetical protein ANN_08379 [Periplaneta americana]|uniref:Uncharacterized protein n=1 Tax=Periplaneta americana TaxID=6978 RepID=A0ABQ8T2T7_PERAM|nr:hypothetical protein ANN_08379 [Periplaneta americana]